MGRIHELPKSSSRLLKSSQIITSVFCVVKELVENALDGGAKNVEVKLEDYGLEKIEIKDNGHGIEKGDIPFVARPHFTSKIASYSDLEKVDTYGFRGEALGAICAVADLIITTKASEKGVGCTVNYDHDGGIVSTKPCPCPQGSMVSVLNLFKNIPVRRQYYRSEKNKKEDLRKVEELLIAYGCIAFDVRFALHHNKNLIWQKPALSCTKNALIHVLGNSVVDHLKYSEYVDEQNQRKFEIYLPLPEAPQTCGLSSPSRCIVSINNRPVRIKSFDKLIKDSYNKAIENMKQARYPICFISFTIPLREVDINIEPNKTKVMLHHSDEILSQFSEMLKNFYNTNVIENNQNSLTLENAESNVQLKETPSDFLDSIKMKCNENFQQSKLHFTESPLSAKKSFLDNDVTILSSSSTQKKKRESPLVKKDIIKEPCKKKLKSSFHASKNDIENHLTSLKNFFSQDKTSDNNVLLSSVPTVTVERITSAVKSSDAEKLDDNTNSNKVTSFSVSTNICTDNNPQITVNTAMNEKRHFTDPSVSNAKFPEADCPVIDNAEAWSRGVRPLGGLFQPVKVLQPKTCNVPESSSKEPPVLVIESKKKVCEQKSFSFERKLTAFDIFCRNNRLEVAAQNPDLNNQQIAQILSEKWNHLSSEEKAVFKNMLDKDYKQSVKKKEKLGEIVSQSLNQTQNKTFHKISKKTKPKLKAKVISFHIQDIKEYHTNKNRETLPSDELDIINFLAPGIWICSKRGKLHLLNTFRLHETVIYHRLLETFQFEPEHLEESFYITANDVGDDGMEVLIKLSKIQITGTVNIDDQRITANGFDVKVSKGPENNVIVELVGVANNVAFYGIPDLKELLLLIKSKGYSTSLSECRPGKVVLYLQSEANRMSRRSPAFQRTQDVQDLLNQNNVLNRCTECIHHKPFFNELWNFQ